MNTRFLHRSALTGCTLLLSLGALSCTSAQTPGSGASVPAKGLAANSVAANSVAANSVAANSVAANSVAANSVAANSVAANSVAANSVAANSVAANSVAAGAYPLGVVVGPGGAGVPTEAEQKFYYQWAHQNGFNILEHEWMPISGGWIGWGEIQTGPDTWNWGGYDSAVRDAEAAGMTTMLEIMTWYRVPQWLFDKYPDLYMQTPLGGGDTLTPVKRDERADTTPIGSLAHPAHIAAMKEYVMAVARRYKGRPGVRGYIIAEERGLPGVWPAGNYYGIDYSPAMADAYHRHLERKFKTIEALNAAWGHPGRYKAFSEVNWRSGWAHDAANYRGEWLEYYRALQQVFANYHNELAKAIHAVDPKARIMVSDYAPLVNRVGHGAYLPLFTAIDEVGYKSYWNDQRMQMDYCSGQSGGKDVWVSNFSEAATTTGPSDRQRYMEPRYIRRSFWTAFSHGLKGSFFWMWNPNQSDKMSLMQPHADGSLELIPAVQTIQQLSEFMQLHWPALRDFKPAAPQIAVHDPNLTFISQQWQYADPKPERAKWSDTTPAGERYHKMVDVIPVLNRRFTISTDENMAKALAAPNVQVLALTGCDMLEDDELKIVTGWIEKGKPIIIDDQTGRYSALGAQRDSLAPYQNRPNVLTLHGERWDHDEKEVARLTAFLNERLPLPYTIADPAKQDAVAVAMMVTPGGDEMAVITRRTTSGRVTDDVGLTLNWKRAHRTVTSLDPFAALSSNTSTLPAPQNNRTSVTLPGFQDTMLVIARN